MTLMIDPCHIWNVIYNARREHRESSSNFTKYCACHEKWLSWLILVTYETTLRGAALVTVQHHQILRLPRNSEFKMSAENSVNCFRQYKDDSTTIRWRNRHLAPAASETLLVPSCRRILYGKIQHFALRLSPKISQSAVPATKSDAPPSPNTAPATKSDSEPLYSELLYSELLRSELLYSDLLCSELFYSQLLYSQLLCSELLCSELLCSELLYAELPYSELLCSELVYSELLYSELVYSELLYSELLDSELLYSKLLYSQLLYSELLYSEVLYSELLDSKLLYSELLYSELLDLYSELLDCCGF